MNYEEIDLALHNKIDRSTIHSEMTDQECRFVHGLIRHSRPKRLLELGVSRGGGSVNLLNAISDDEEATLTSIDRAETCTRYNNVKVGSDVAVGFPELAPGKWKLLTGVDSSEVLESLGGQFDFAVINTAHVHPVESLNFLCVLPYLRDGAIVAMHDISLFYHEGCGRRAIASRVLISTLVGEKIFPAYKGTHYISQDEPVHNICAVTITPELRQHIGNVFVALSLPWEMYPARDIANVRKLLEKHYSAEHIELFDEADRTNLAWHISGGATFSIHQLATELKKLGNKAIFYGAGLNMHFLLQLYHHSGLQFDYPIWDINAERINQIEGHPVSLPDFETNASGITAVITISSPPVANSVRAQLERIGYNCICGLEELFSTGSADAIPFPVEFTEEEKELLLYVERNGLTMVSRERMFATMMSCKYVVENNIPGDFVECGVWRGGNAILAAGMFKLYGSNKKIWLFDTFLGFVDAGITRGVHDGVGDAKRREELQRMYYNSEYCGNSIDDVKTSFERYGLLSDNIRFIKGDVMQTLEGSDIPPIVAVLRLDTDYYDSTLKELEVLYPKLSTGGVLLIDDYGAYDFNRKAVEDYFTNVPRPMLQHTDYTGRTGIKVTP